MSFSQDLGLKAVGETLGWREGKTQAESPRSWRLALLPGGHSLQCRLEVFLGRQSLEGQAKAQAFLIYPHPWTQTHGSLELSHPALHSVARVILLCLLTHEKGIQTFLLNF